MNVNYCFHDFPVFYRSSFHRESEGFMILKEYPAGLVFI